MLNDLRKTGAGGPSSCTCAWERKDGPGAEEDEDTVSTTAQLIRRHAQLRRVTTAPPEEALQRSPTQPPLADADAPSLTATVCFVAGLLAASGVVAWLTAPFIV